MKTIKYKGIDLEVIDSTIIHTYNNKGNADIEFNKPIYNFEGLTFNSLEDVDKYLGNRQYICTYKGFNIYRILARNIITKGYDKRIVYTIKNVDECIKICYPVQSSRLDAIIFINGMLREESKIIKPHPSFNDNRLAIKMLNSVSEILSAIESDDCDLIELNLTELEERLDKFKKVYYDNKRNGVYS